MKFTTLLFCFNLILLFSNCNGQKNPKYLGKEYGSFDLDRITFDENLDSLFSKVDKADLILIEGKDSYYDTIQKKEINTNVTEYVYRMRRTKADGVYVFKDFKIKDAVVSFYTDKDKIFRRADFSTYMTTKEYNDLLNKTKDYKVVTDDEVKAFNGGKYIILEKKDGTKKTTLYCLKTDDEDGDYFVRIRINDQKIKYDRFDKKWNTKSGF